MKFIITICILTLALFLASVAVREAPASAYAPAPVAKHVPWSLHFPAMLIDDAPPGPTPHSRKGASFKLILTIIGITAVVLSLLWCFWGCSCDFCNTIFHREG